LHGYHSHNKKTKKILSYLLSPLRFLIEINLSV
jgi:hypothetical protein